MRRLSRHRLRRAGRLTDRRPRIASGRPHLRAVPRPLGPHDGQDTDARQVCTTCHDAEHWIDFSLARALPLIDHYAANQLTEAEFEDCLRALARGDLPRPLAALPTGTTAGEAACAACHKHPHRSWKHAPLAHAMELLRGDDATNKACVASHAAARQAGPAPASVDGYRTDEGVRCESCHGPLAAHARNPTADNIVGLGKSCSECIIEAVCTTCHTSEWDRSARLKAIAH